MFLKTQPADGCAGILPFLCNIVFLISPPDFFGVAFCKFRLASKIISLLAKCLNLLFLYSNRHSLLEYFFFLFPSSVLFRQHNYFVRRFRDGMSISSGVAVDRSACGAGNSHRPFQSGQAILSRFVYQLASSAPAPATILSSSILIPPIWIFIIRPP